MIFLISLSISYRHNLSTFVLIEIHVDSIPYIAWCANLLISSTLSTIYFVSYDKTIHFLLSGLHELPMLPVTAKLRYRPEHCSRFNGDILTLSGVLW